MLSPSDTAIVFLLALLLFGPEQLPRIARQLGEAMRQMQSTTHAFMNELERAARVHDSEQDRAMVSADAEMPAHVEPPTPSDGGSVTDAPHSN